MKTKKPLPAPSKAPIWLHGECTIKIAENLDESQLVPLEVTGNYLVVADSEQSGNHHVMDRAPGVTFLKHVVKKNDETSLGSAVDDEGVRRFARIDPGCKAMIRCVHPDRHSEMVFEAPADKAIYLEFGTQKEYDPFTEALRNVRD